MAIALGIIGGIVLLFFLYIMSSYNGMVRGKNMVDEAWSGINVQLKRRHDLIPSLVNTVKGYAEHESSVLRQVTEARASAVSAAAASATAGGVKNVMQAENNLMHTLRSLFAVAENYPQLKANENFLQLQHQLSEIEDEIQMSRRYYNGTAREQNNRVLQFPGNLIANHFGFEKVTYFELDDESERAVPEVKF
ncbi:MAG: LemA family protein [Desulfovibrionaceae bacterium]|nr:LemA family protein [Desulfovibrionaceae bacterium]